MNDFLLKKFNEIETQHWWWEGRRQLVRQLITQKRPQKILDIGCGTGETLSFIKSLFPKSLVYGVDTSIRALNYSRARGHKKIYKSNALNLPFKDNTFDVILFLDVLEHIEKDVEAIKEAQKKLKKNGSIIITSPGLQFIWSKHDSEQGHKRRYTRRRIQFIARESNLRTSFVSYFNFFLSPPIILIRLLSNVKMFSNFARYDNGINYDIAKLGLLNGLLKKIFVFEIKALRFINYPIGISIGAVLNKK